MLPNLLSAFFPSKKTQGLPGLQQLLQGFGGAIMPGLAGAGQPPAAGYPRAITPAGDAGDIARRPRVVPGQPITQFPTDDLGPTNPGGGFSPYGVQRTAMDERLPNGQSVQDAVSAELKKQGGYPGMASSIPDTPEYREYQAAQQYGVPGTNPTSGNDPLNEAYGRRDDLMKNGVPKEDKFWKRALRGALAGVGASGGKGGIGGIIGGAATGAAAGGFFPQVDTKIRTAEELARTNARIGTLEDQRTKGQKYRAGESIIDDRYTDNIRQQENLKRQIAKDEKTANYWKEKIDLGKVKLADDEELRILRDKWMDSKNVTDKRRLDLIEKEMENRNIRSEAQIKSREGIAGQRMQMTAQENQIKRQMQAAVKQYDAAVKSKNILEQEESRKRLLELKQQLEAGQ